VYVSGRSSINMFVADLERIEVVKGPQSALYGRNTFSGAINLITRKPGDTTDGYGEVTVGSKNRYEIKTAAGGPIVEGKVQARLSAVWHDWGGYYKNQAPGGDRLGDQRTWQAALSLRLLPADNLEILVRLSQALDRDEQPALRGFAPNCAPTVPSGGFKLYCGQAPSITGPFAVNDYAYGLRRETTRSSVTATLGLGFADLISTTGLQYEQSNFLRDDDYTPQPDYTRQQSTARRDFSQDLRLTSTGNDPVSWLAGVNLYRFTNDIRQRDINSFLGLPAAGARSISTTLAVAGYGSVTWKPVETVGLTGELRWSDERKTFVSEIRDRTGIPLDLEARWKSWTPKFAASWQVAAPATLYASVARGFKTGGFNDMTNLFDQERAYQPETNWTYEVGAKTRWLDGRLWVDGSLFWVDWSNQQVSASSAAAQSLNFYNTNAGSSVSKGFELAVRARPIQGLSVDLSYAFTDATFRRYSDPDLVTAQGFAPTGSVAGNMLPRYSRHQAAGSVEWQQPLSGSVGLLGDLLGPNVDWFVRGEATWQSRQYAEASNTTWVGDALLVNARLGLTGPRFELGLWTKNLFDNRTPPVVIRFNVRNQGAATRAFLVQAADGRTVGLTLRLPFGV
jgi:iron complex outermembrane receptor protein